MARQNFSGNDRRREWSTPQLLAIAWIVIAALILVVFYLRPEREALPPPSKVDYTAARPESSDVHSGGVIFGPSQRKKTRAKETTAEEGILSSVIEAGGRCLITGKITAAKTGLPVEHARVAATTRRVHGAATAEGSSGTEETTLDPTETLPSSFEYNTAIIRMHGSPTVQTDKNGEFRIYVPQNENGYVVLAVAKGYLSEQEDVQFTSETEEKRVSISLKTGAALSGKVKEAGTGMPVAEMTLHCGRESQTAVDTKEDGTYRFDGLMPGKYEVTLDLEGMPYRPGKDGLTRSVEISALETELTNIDFTVEPAGTVWGYVYGTDRKPEARIPVMLCTSDSLVNQLVSNLTRQQTPLNAITGTDGYYEIVGVPLNTEHRIQTFPTPKTTPQLSDPFMMSPSTRSVRVDVYLPRGCNIEGIVVTPDGVPVSGAELFCAPALSRLVSPLTSTLGFSGGKSEKDGRFQIPSLPEGDYQIYAMAKGYKHSLRGVPVYVRGQDVGGVRVEVTPIGIGQHQVYGTVTDTSGSPLPGIRLELISFSLDSLDNEPRSTTTDPNGAYSFSGVDEGQLLLQVGGGAYGSKIVDNVNLDASTDIQLEAAGRIAGRVLLRETGEPVANAHVEIMPDFSAGNDFSGENFGGFDNSTTNENGGFSAAVPAGRYTLRATADDLVPGTATTQVTTGATTSGVVIMVSREGGTIEGRVVTTTGAPVADAAVTFLSSSTSYGGLLPAIAEQAQGRRSITTDSDGAFRIEKLPAGAYQLYAQKEGYAQGQAGPVVLQAGQTASNVRLVLGNGGSLRGYVSIDGALKPGIVVTLIGNGLSKMGTTDQNGQYVIENIPAGTYLASAADVGALMSGSFAPAHARVEIYDGQVTTHNFGEEQGVTLTGQVTPPPTNGRIGFVIVRVPTPEGIESLNLSNPASWFRGDSTTGNYILGMGQLDKEGNFRIANLPQGQYLLEVYHVGLTSILAQGGRPVYSQMFDIGDTTQVNVSIRIGEAAPSSSSNSGNE